MPRLRPQSSQVLIESDWNLKPLALAMACYGICVLIESDWNLKIFKKERLKKHEMY